MRERETKTAENALSGHRLQEPGKLSAHRITYFNESGLRVGPAPAMPPRNFIDLRCIFARFIGGESLCVAFYHLSL
jgi:hypothetical protein